MSTSRQDGISLGVFVRQAQQFLAQQGSPTPRVDTLLFIESLLGLSQAQVLLQESLILTVDQQQQLEAMLQRRSQGESVAAIVGFKDFFVHRFVVGPDTLIPRPETELVVEQALQWWQEQGRPPDINIFDLGCGSGCIGLSLLYEISQARLWAVDQSPAAVQYTTANAKKLGVIDRTMILQLNVQPHTKLENVKFNLIVANPPYIAEQDSRLDESVKKFEPFEALFSGPDGLECIRDWTQVAAKHLHFNGAWIFEIGAGQLDEVKVLLKTQGFEFVRVKKDYSQYDRVVVAKWPHRDVDVSGD